MSIRGKLIGTALAMATILVATGAAPAHAGSGVPDVGARGPLSGSSTSGRSSISGYYDYYADGTAGGRTKYDGSFTDVKLTDNVSGDGFGAALVLEFDEWVNGAWGHVYPYISRTGSSGTTSWNFNDKANIRVSVCDYNSNRDFFNCRRIV